MKQSDPWTEKDWASIAKREMNIKMSESIDV